MKISSLQNSKVKLVRKLRDRRNREQEQRFVIDYGRDLLRAIDNGYEVDFLLFCPEVASEDDCDLLNNVEDHKIYEVPLSLIEKASYRQNPSAWIAILKSKSIRQGVSALDAIDSSYILGLVNLKKPGNVGALLRTADATDFRAILLIDSVLDVYNPNMIRSSTGACFLDNIYMISSEEALTFFKSHGYSIVVAVVEDGTRLFDVGLPNKTAIILGTEDRGLSDFWIQNADQRVKIPMLGTLTDSLNVSVSGAVFMYEVVRQRLNLHK